MCGARDAGCPPIRASDNSLYIPNWICGVLPHHRVPFAHMPMRHKPRLHVGIILRETLRYRARTAFEHDNRAIDGIGKRAAQHELAAGLRFPRQSQVLGAKWGASLE